MSQFWEQVVTHADGLYKAEDCELAAYRLVSEQVLYHSDRNSRIAYSLIERYERDYKRALAPLGIAVLVNRQLRFAIATPNQVKVSPATVAQTLMALVLRKIYDEAARVGEQNDEGQVICDVVELEEKYRLATGRSFPAKGELNDLLWTLKRWGIARKSADDEKTTADEGDVRGNFAVIILPAIAIVLGENALQRLGQWAAVTESQSDIEASAVNQQEDAL